MKRTLILSTYFNPAPCQNLFIRRLPIWWQQKKIDRIIELEGFKRNTERLLRWKRVLSFYNRFYTVPSFKNFQDEIILIKRIRRFHFEQITELLEKKVHETILEVNLDAIVHNFQLLSLQTKARNQDDLYGKAYGYGRLAHLNLPKHCRNIVAITWPWR